LFEYYLDAASGEAKLERAKRVVALAHGGRPDRQLDVSIVAWDFLEEYAVALTNEVDAYIDALLPFAKEIVAGHEQRRERMRRRSESHA